MRTSTLTATFLITSLMAGSAYAQKTFLERYQPTSKAGMRSSIKATQDKVKTTRVTTADKKSKANEDALTAFTMSVDGITTGKNIPPRFTYCTSNGSGGTRDAANINPAIKWSPPPTGTKSLVVLVVDKDVPASFENANVPHQSIAANAPRQDFYHWVLVDIPPNIGGLLEGRDSNGITPGGKTLGTKPYGTSGQNDYAMMSAGDHGGYDGPCPPWNDERIHNYHFTVYALDIPTLKLPSPVKGKQAVVAMRTHILAQAEVVGTFTTNPDWIKRARQKKRAAAKQQ